MQGKIIGVGFQKTGTTTLGKALKILGYSVKGTTPGLLIPVLKGDYEKVLKKIEGYDALQDTPWFMIYKELDKRLPGSKFILTLREQESWYKSVSKHFGERRSPVQEWVYGRGKGVPAEDKENSLRVYNNHNEEVQNYFKGRPDDLLVMDFTRGDGWEKLCNFLGEEIPDVPFPHSNNSAESKPRKKWSGKLKSVRKNLRHYLKIKYIDWKGYW